ncbi:hypothetical protein BC828DRAFT_389452 [Blastocladiella britannica]|nr:hypothetical protein BC828DRAFT_389452 [Blastocladiella britannica]
MPSPYPETLAEKYSFSGAMGALYTCYSFRYQAMSYYRYGQSTDCSARWDHFKFCLSIRTKPDDIVETMVAERETRLAREQAAKPSSLDVWELRDKPPANFPPDVAEWATGHRE